jgi:tetratricopeptide (TPR) repeat protein
MAALNLLRQLAEQQDYEALREACVGAGSDEPSIQVLLALADAHLGHRCAARHLVGSLDSARLTIDVRVDLAAVHIALGEVDRAAGILEVAHDEAAAAAPADRARLLARLAWCRLVQERHDDALALYERSVRHRPILAVYLNLLRLYRDSGRAAEMARCLDAARRCWAEEQADWPDDHRRVHERRLRAAQLDVWLASRQFDTAEAWVEGEFDAMAEPDWCALVADLAQRLASHDRHAEAEEWLRSGLRRYPENVLLHGQLAELAQLLGRQFQAIALLRRAIVLAGAQNQPTASLWTRLSAAALQSNPDLAREAAERARDQHAGHSGSAAGDARLQLHSHTDLSLQVELALAEVEAQSQDHTAAERRYRQVLEQQPHRVPALLGLGRLLLQLGRIDEAAALFQRVRVADPVRGHSALMFARRFPEDEATLQRLERLARTPRLEGSVCTGLLLHLAAAWEKRGDYQRAFALADEANAASRRLLRYDPKAHRQHCARIRHAFPKALYEHRPDCGHESTLPLFVVGMPRSGTTLVEQILAGHSRIHGAGELGTIPRVIAGLERWERRTGSGRRYPDCVDDLDPRVARGIAENVLNELRGYAPEADHVVDKLPHNFENIGLIRLLFPGARVISVRRDPRDIAVSNYFLDFAAKHGGMGFAYHLDWIGEQLADHNLLMHHWHQVWPEGILEIRYEDVVGDPETSARRMLDHIGVDWEPQVLEFDALERPVRTASVWQVRQPLYASSKSRWRRFRRHLGPLIAATNRRITWDPIEMVTLPEPGWLNAGVDLYRQGDLDAAEYRFKQLLHHLPEHAAACFMLGSIYVRKGHRDDGIALMERALDRCPWNRHWRSDLARAYRLAGRDADASALRSADGDAAVAARAGPESGPGAAVAPALRLDYLFLSGETTCTSPGSSRSGANC